MGTNASDAPRIIKRYANRKLYDSTLRRFTTLDEVASLIQSGVNVVVTDHESGADRTQDVLAQVLGRRIMSGSGDTDALSSLLRSPASVTAGLASDLLGPVASRGKKLVTDKDEKKSSKKTPEDKKKSSKKKPADKKAKPSPSDSDREELIELRKQVSELTSVVHLLLKERSGE